MQIFLTLKNFLGLRSLMGFKYKTTNNIAPQSQFISFPEWHHKVYWEILGLGRAALEIYAVSFHFTGGR